MISSTLQSYLSFFHSTDPHPGHFGQAFFHSLAMVIATEIGDRTFFIAAILAMSTTALIVFIGCWGALAFMTVLSALIGLLVPTLLSPVLSHWFSVLLFGWFGGKAIFDAYGMFKNGEGAGVSEELEETQKELDDDKTLKKNRGAVALIVAIFTMTFMAEWGDKSQIATVAMGGSRDVMGVIVGAVLGHGLCTGMAIAGGKMMSSRISERQVTLASGILFLGFATNGVFSGPET